MRINEKLIKSLRDKKLKLSAAESVTGGKLISSLIEVPGASKVIDRSFVVYSDQAKVEVLGIDPKLIEAFGVVSEEVALDMARKVKQMTGADVALSTTGEAGPSLNEVGINVGTVCFGMIIDGQEHVFKKVFAGDRLGIIENAVTFILNDLFYRL